MKMIYEGRELKLDDLQVKVVIKRAGRAGNSYQYTITSDYPLIPNDDQASPLSAAKQGMNQGYIDGRSGLPRNEYQPDVCNEDYRREYICGYALGSSDRKQAEQKEAALREQITDALNEIARLEKERDEAKKMAITGTSYCQMMYEHGFCEGVQGLESTGFSIERQGRSYYETGYKAGCDYRAKMVKDTRKSIAKEITDDCPF